MSVKAKAAFEYKLPFGLSAVIESENSIT